MTPPHEPVPAARAAFDRLAIDYDALAGGEIFTLLRARTHRVFAECFPGGARGVTAQELQWGIEVEGALGVDDLLDRRTRLGLVPQDREASMDAAAAAFERAGVDPV